MLLYSPTHLFFWPALILALLGMLIQGVLVFGPVRIGSQLFGFHWMFVGSLLTLVGFQVIQLGVVARFVSLTSHLDKDKDTIVGWLQDHFRLESGIALGGGIFALGILLDAVVLASWLTGNFESATAVRVSLVALTFSVIGLQLVFSAFLVSMLTVARQGWSS
jgi:hypothetical protein